MLEKSNQNCSSLENSKRLLEENLRKLTSDLRNVEQQNTVLEQKVGINHIIQKRITLRMQLMINVILLPRLLIVAHGC